MTSSETSPSFNTPIQPATPSWMSRVLVAAGIYNILWGAYAVLLPLHMFSLFGMEPPRYPELWQCIGMIVGVYGVGYLAAATDPMRHWPVVLVGFLGKVFGPIGFLQAAITGAMPWSFGLNIIFNDLIWWVPFFLILREAYRREWLDEIHRPVAELAAMMRQPLAHTGASLAELSKGREVLVLFLRHSGCTFCREALADLARDRAGLEAKGMGICLVHMSSEADAARTFDAYGLGDVPRISDPSRDLYRAFGLRRGRLLQLFGPSCFWRGAYAALVQRHGIGGLDGDGAQMPGAFIVRDGRVVREFRHPSASSRPDLPGLAAGTCGLPAPQG